MRPSIIFRKVTICRSLIDGNGLGRGTLRQLRARMTEALSALVEVDPDDPIQGR
jgi:hypothetical protein